MADRVRISQCQKPNGWLGRFVLWRMNASHSGVTDWGLSHVSIGKRFTVLDVGCGGGRTLGKLAQSASEGKVYGVDYSEASVAVSRRNNAQLIERGRVEVQQGSVSHLPFQENMFDLVTAVETHFWWPNPHDDMKEVFRVVKPGGRGIVIAEVYRGADSMASKMAETYASRTGMALFRADEHGELLANAGFSDIKIDTIPAKGWICAVGVKS